MFIEHSHSEDRYDSRLLTSIYSFESKINGLDSHFNWHYGIFFFLPAKQAIGGQLILLKCYSFLGKLFLLSYINKLIERNAVERKVAGSIPGKVIEFSQFT
jgi:hypothetical protein